VTRARRGEGRMEEKWGHVREDKEGVERDGGKINGGEGRGSGEGGGGR